VSAPSQTVLSLTFDDALDCHLDIVAPLLDSYALRGTFYVHIAAPALSARWPEWGALASRGHELGNHTLLHPAEARRGWVTAANRIEDYTLERMGAELDVANDVLRMIDGRTLRSFAYPCGIDMLGRDGWPRRLLRTRALHSRRWSQRLLPFTPAFGTRRENYTPVVQQRFYCARGGQAREALDRFHLPGVSADDLDHLDHGALLDAAAARPWSILTWHGIDGGHGLTSSRDSLAALLARLAKDPRFRVRSILDAAHEFWG
jgi:peptidoglycan/xylan/chitin deacetylase (PgdA/CDA1 family)